MKKRISNSVKVVATSVLCMFAISFVAQTTTPTSTVKATPSTVKASPSTSAATTSTVKSVTTSTTSTTSTNTNTTPATSTNSVSATTTLSPKPATSNSATPTPTASSNSVTAEKPKVVKPSESDKKEDSGVSEETPASAWVNPEHTSEENMSFADGWFFGGDIGKSLHYGDVALYNVFPKTQDFKKSFGNCGSFYFGKKFLWGLSVEIEGFMGTLKGEKRSGTLYPRQFVGNYFQYAGSVKYNLSQLVFRDVPGRKFFNRFTFYITGGAGQMFFRSRLYKQANNGLWYLENATGYKTSGIDSIGPGRGSGLITEKTKMKAALAVPVGTKINFKLNGQTDLVLNLTYSTIFSDHLDSWVRSWSHKDRYLHIGFGLNHNINSGSEGDIPVDQRFLRPKSKSSKDAYEKGSVKKDSGKSGSERKGLFKSGSAKSSKTSKKDDKDLELRMKMYEMQLKLFEMQYLMGGG